MSDKTGQGLIPVIYEFLEVLPPTAPTISDLVAFGQIRLHQFHTAFLKIIVI